MSADNPTMVILGGNCDRLPRELGEWQLREIDYWRSPDGKEQRGPYLVFACPNGRGACGVPIAPSPANSNRAVWTWDGNATSPTLSPSINCIALDENGNQKPGIGCGWHGFMSAGVLR